MNSDPAYYRTASRTMPLTTDPLELFKAAAGGRADTALLESRDGNGRNNTQSILLLQSALRIEGHGREVHLIPLTENGKRVIEALSPELNGLVEISHDADIVKVAFPSMDPTLSEFERLKAPGPADVLRLLALRETSGEELPLMLLGMFGYDFLDTFEQLPEAKRDNLNTPNMVFELPELLLHVDHPSEKIELRTFGYLGNAPDEVLLDETAALLAGLPATKPGPPATSIPSTLPSNLEIDLNDEEYGDIVATLKQNIVAGDVFQIVPSRTFHLPCDNPISAYRHLRHMNPSPYLFYLNAGSFTLFGSSPETCVRVDGDPKNVTLFPIAGTRPRGRKPDGSIDPDLDNRLEAELKLHKKELAEHMMLVDLARNDVARICEPGTRKVSRLLEIERYSHVMHLVSLVEGKLKSGFDALHAYLATMNMGTLTGAPKVEAARLLRLHESDKRGPYGGAVGYLTSSGDMDTAIIIRSAVVKDGTAYVRAGAGVVYDSDPQAEADETSGKANAVLQAILAAGGDA